MTMIKRPMLHIAISYCTGIILAWHLRQVFIIMILFLIIMLTYTYGMITKIPIIKKLLLWGIFVVLGYINFAFQFTFLIEPLQPYYETPVTMNGYVTSACEEEKDKITFEYFVENVDFLNKDVYIGRVILINVYNADSSKDYSLGTRFIVSGVLRKPDGSRNPGGFNYESFLFSKKIPAFLSANNNEVKFTGTVKSLPVKVFAIKMREYILSSLQKYLSKEKAALLAAILTGYRGNLTESMEDAFSSSGLTHIMAVSGAHLVFLVFPLLWVFRIIGFNRRAAAIITIPFVFIYVLITGMGPSVLRAAVMMVLILLGRVLNRNTELINSLGVAAVLLLIVNPFLLFDVGFQLSVGATAGIGVLYRRVRGVFSEKIPRVISETMAATISAQAGIMPFLILYFNKVSVISLFSNLLVVPVTGTATCLGAVCIAAGSIHSCLGIITGYVLEGILHFILIVADACASVTWAVIYMHHWKWWFVCLYYVVVFLWGVFGIRFLIHHKAKVFTCAFIIGAVLFIQGIIPGTLKVIFIDVGQGDSILIKTPGGKNYLLDGGGSYNESETGYCGRQVILPTLMHEKITHIDMVVVTHAHSDHMAGVLTLIELLPIKSVGLPKYPAAEQDFNELISLCEKKNILVCFFHRDDIIQMDDRTSLEILYPDSDNIHYYGNLNNTSLCGMLSFEELNILFTGDIESEAEDILLKYGDDIDCDILKVAHHGGKNSTSSDFLNCAKPEISIISVGRNNFGHPSDEVLDRLILFRSRIYITQESGAVIMESNGERFWIRQWIRDYSFTFF